MDTQPVTIALRIPRTYATEVENRVRAYARKARRLGMTEPTIRVLREVDHVTVRRDGSRVAAGFPAAGVAEAAPGETAEQALARLERWVEIASRGRASLVITPFVEVEVTGERPVVAGWDLAARLEHLPTATLVHRSPAFEGGDLPERFRDCAPDCEHCGLDRRRGDTFVVSRLDDEGARRFVQVGRTCLQDFLADPSVEAALHAFTFLQEIEVMGGEDSWGGCRAPEAAPGMLDYLALVACAVRRLGWVSGRAAYESEDLQSTRSRVGLVLRPGRSRELQAEADAFRASVRDGDRARAERALAWIRGPGGAAVDGDYGHNLRALCALDWVASQHEGIVASLLVAHARALDLDPTTGEARAAVLDEYLPLATPATVDQRLSWRLRVEAVRPTRYGYAISLRDAEGRAAVAFAAPEVWTATDPKADLEGGREVVVFATVRKLGNHYKLGYRETVLARASFYAASDLDALADADRDAVVKSPAATVRRTLRQIGRADATPTWCMTASQRRKAAKAAA